MSKIPLFNKDGGTSTSALCPNCNKRTNFTLIPTNEISDAETKDWKPAVKFLGKATIFLIGSLVRTAVDFFEGESEYRCDECGKCFRLSLSGGKIHRGNPKLDR